MIVLALKCLSSLCGGQEDADIAGNSNTQGFLELPPESIPLPLSSDNEVDENDHIDTRWDYEDIGETELATAEMNARRRQKVYGKKNTFPATSSTAAIFAAPSPPSGSKPSTVRHPLEDVTNALASVRIDDGGVGPSRGGKGKGRPTSVCSESISSVSATRSTRSATIAGTVSATENEDQRYEWLKPLTSEYEADGRHKVAIHKWDDILEEKWSLEKIAESSFAEVYKVTNDEGTSVLKIMALKPPNGPGSQRETAVPVESVISEVLIMDMLAEIPGFLEFKDAHIIEGRPPKAMREAYDAHVTKKGHSYFPKPSTYHKDQLFLALELGDAGTDIEHFRIQTLSDVWDIFLGIVIALTFGENLADFEHRDLHEGNVCVKRTKCAMTLPQNQRHKFGYSGLQITLLDYTLSRASQNGIIRWRDLEQDYVLFTESAQLQHQMYRRMRAWVVFKTHGTTHKLWDKRKAYPDQWKIFHPYTNVIWIWYILNHIIQFYDGDEAIDSFMTETYDLRMKLNPDKAFRDGGFARSGNVLDFCVEQGWIDEDDLSGLGVSSFEDTHPPAAPRPPESP